jgi:hypothetical protein
LLALFTRRLIINKLKNTITPTTDNVRKLAPIDACITPLSIMDEDGSIEVSSIPNTYSNMPLSKKSLPMIQSVIEALKIGGKINNL